MVLNVKILVTGNGALIGLSGFMANGRLFVTLGFGVDDLWPAADGLGDVVLPDESNGVTTVA
jgi:hypothetical protein